MSRPVCLFLECAPKQLVSLDVQAELDATGLGHGDHRIILKHVVGARLETIKTAIVAHAPVMLHFSGHGGRLAAPSTSLTVDPLATSYGVLYVESSTGPAPLRADELAQLLGSDGQQLTLVVLSACESDEFARQFLELRPSLEIIVSSAARLTDDQVRSFSRQFYRDLERGRTVQEAFDTARVAAKVEAGIDAYRLRERVTGAARKCRLVAEPAWSWVHAITGALALVVGVIAAWLLWDRGRAPTCEYHPIESGKLRPPFKWGYELRFAPGRLASDAGALHVRFEGDDLQVLGDGESCAVSVSPNQNLWGLDWDKCKRADGRADYLGARATGWGPDPFARGPKAGLDQLRVAWRDGAGRVSDIQECELAPRWRPDPSQPEPASPARREGER